MIKLTAFLIAAVVVSGAAQAEPVRGEPRYRLSLVGGGMGNVVDETVVFLRVDDVSGRFWVVERHKAEQRLGVRPPVPVLHQWIDGRDCKALAGVLAGIGRLPPQRMVGAEEADAAAPPSDTPEIRLRGPAASQDGGMGVSTVRVEYFGPLAKWWSEGGRALAGCWRDGPVRTAEGEVASWLGTPEDIARMKP